MEVAGHHHGKLIDDGVPTSISSSDLDAPSLSELDRSEETSGNGLLSFLAAAQQLAAKPIRTFDGFTAGGNGWSWLLSELADHDNVELSSDTETNDLAVLRRDTLTRESRLVYELLFEMNERLLTGSGKTELLLCAGLLSGDLDGRKTNRHLLVTPMELEYRAHDDGAIAIVFGGQLRVEDNFFNAELIHDAMHYAQAKEQLEQLPGSDILTEGTQHQIQSLVTHLSENLRFDSTWSLPNSDEPMVAMTPVLLARQRSAQPIASYLDRAVAGRTQEPKVPVPRWGQLQMFGGVGNAVVLDNADGALLRIDDRRYLATVPLDPEQLAAIISTTESAQTVVHSPPGTGTTHTIASLVSHLLALGKRVLVTAPTGQALVGLRAALPSDFLVFAESLVDPSQQHATDQQISIAARRDRADELDPEHAAAQEARLTTELGQLRTGYLAALERRTVASDSHTGKLTICGAHRSRADHVRWVEEQGDRHSWLRDVPRYDEAPISDQDFSDMMSILQNRVIQDLLDESHSIELVAVPTQDEFDNYLEEYNRCKVDLASIESGEPVAPDRAEAELFAIANELEQLESSNHSHLFLEVYQRNITASRVTALMLESDRIVDALDALVEDCSGDRVTCSVDPTTLLPYVDAVESYLESGKTFRLDESGVPKSGLFRGDLDGGIKKLFETARVGTRPPTNLRSIRLFKRAVELMVRTENIAQKWQVDVPTGDFDDFGRYLDGVINGIERVGELRSSVEAACEFHGIGKSVMASSALARSVAIERQRKRVETSLASATEQITDLLRMVDDQRWEWQKLLASAVSERSARRFVEFSERIAMLRAATADNQIAQDHVRRILPAAPELAADLLLGHLPAAANLEEAWRFARTSALLESLNEANAVAAVIAHEDRIRSALRERAAIRAWKHALSDERTSEEFPVRIMALHHVWEHVDPANDEIDVVILEQASLAGPEAAALFELAPRTVVFGDDGYDTSKSLDVDPAEYAELAARHFADDALTTMENPNRSAFEIAKHNTGEIITLRQHRRSVPEIVEFVNRVGFTDDTLQLESHRETSTNALSPIRTTFVPVGKYDKYVNEPEAEMLVQTILRCCSDPAYDDMTFGVIVLQSNKQRRRIESMLIDRLDPSEWKNRQLRVGPPGSFRGVDRNVIFGSLVVDANSKSRPLTTKADHRRFVTAISRANDQFWLFHSIESTAISDPECVRRRLLEYCAEVDAPTIDQVTDVDVVVRYPAPPPPIAVDLRDAVSNETAVEELNDPESAAADIDDWSSRDLVRESRPVPEPRPRPNVGTTSQLIGARSLPSMVGGHGNTRFAPYVEWTPRALPPIVDMVTSELTAVIVEIANVEGPVAVSRVYTQLANASGQTKAERSARRAIDEAISNVDGTYLYANTGPRGSYSDGWIRTPGQRTDVRRELGPRNAVEVPTPELVAALEYLSTDNDHAEDVYLGLAEEYGMERITMRNRVRFERAYAVLQEDRS